MIRRFTFLTLIAIACRPASPPAAGDDVSPVTISEALARHTDSLLSVPGVVGVGEGQLDGKPAIQILVVELTAALRSRLPTVLDGHPVQLVGTGVIRAQPDSASR